MRVLTLLSMILMFGLSVSAQETTITVQNAPNLTQLAVLGYGEVSDLALTPNGKLLAMATHIGVVVTETRAPDAAQRLTGSEFQAITVAVNPDSTRVAAGGWDNSLRVWDLATGDLLLENRDHNAGVTVVLFSPDGLTLASAGDNGSVRLWDADKLSIRTVINDLPTPMFNLSFSPDSAVLAAATFSGVVLVDTTSGTQIATLTGGHTDGTNSVAFLPDGTLVSADESGRVISWDIATQTQIAAFENFGVPVWDMAVADGELLTVGGDEILRRRAQSGEAAALEWVNMPRYPLRAVAAASGGVMATASAQEVSIWETGSGTPVNRLWMPDKAMSAAYSVDGTALAIGTTDGFLTVYDANTLDVRVQINPERGTPTALLFLPDGRLITGWEDGTIAVVGINGEIAAQWPVHTGAVITLAEGAAGEGVVSIGRDETVKVTNLATGESIERERNNTELVFSSLAIAPEGRMIALGSQSSVVATLTLMRGGLRNGERVTLEDGASAAAMAFSPAGETLAVGGSDGVLRFLGLPSLATETVLPAVNGSITGVAYAPDGTWLAFTNLDSILRLVDAETRTPIAELYGHTDSILGLAVNPVASRIVTVGEDGVARVWGVE